MTDHFRNAWNTLTGPGMPFEVSAIEVRGVPLKAYTTVPPTMRAIWESSAAANADKRYLQYEDESYTYGEIGDQVRSLAQYLRDIHGVSSGDRVAIAMRNYPEWVTAYWAIASLGAAVVGMNAWWTGPEMEYGLLDSAPKVLIADDERVTRVLPHLATVRAVAPLHVLSVRSEQALGEHSDRWSNVVHGATAPADLPSADIDPDDDLCIFYTSGTTGFPKGAQLTHRGSVNNTFNVAFITVVSMMADGAAIAAGDMQATTKTTPAVGTSVLMITTPLFHVTANNCGLHPSTLVGGTVVLLRKWDAARALELIEREQVTNFQGVPTMGRELISHPDFARRDTSSLRGLTGGGAAVQPDLVDKIDKSLANGSPTTGYGLTETCGIVTAFGSRNFVAHSASCGAIVPTLEAKLVDADGNDLAADPSTVGELCVRGANVIKGYLNKPEATAQAIKNGWFATGDIAKIDAEGFVYIVDRAKDMVNRGGENVYCTEVEAVIYEHPSVAEVSVFGIPDERLGEDVAAAIMLRPGCTLTVSELRAFVGERIAAYKAPATVVFSDGPLPRNASGKIVKRTLRDELLASRA